MKPLVCSPSSPFVKALRAFGVIPDYCTYFTLTMEPNKVIKINLTVQATEEQVSKIVSALEQNPEEARAIAREIIFKSPTSDATAKVDL